MAGGSEMERQDCRLRAAVVVALALALSPWDAIHADTVINGCTIIDHPASERHMVCPNANLQGIDLTNVDLTGALLTNANLTGATLINANMRGACLREGACRRVGPNLTGANLTAANLQGASLIGAILTNANLRNANLQGALLRARWEHTICPNGTNSDANGGTCEGHLQAAGGARP
jgi:uncharacterized protein YjbI with pentapeptide repeats